MLLAIAGFVVVWFFCGASTAQPVTPAGVKAPSTVTGHGETVEAAKKNAVNKAVDELKNFMAQCELTASVVTEDYVRAHVLRDTGTPGQDLKIDQFDKPFKAWVLTFREGYSSDLVRRGHEAERQARGRERESLGLRLIVGLACVLLAAFGYVRLDEFTQRRYTNTLRVAAVTVAASLLAGWWWVFFQAPGL
jgi:hypothetical protein